ncbi:MAG: TonB family protein [Bacteroidales bacterium]|nr:TonB family protein [Bacteroidales bacterium]
MSNNEKKDKGIAIAGTIIVHALAVLVLFLMAFKTPLPLPGEEGVEVDLGMMDQGMGNLQPETPAIPMTAQPEQQQSKNEEDIVTQNDEETPSIEKPKTTKPKQEQPSEQPKPTVNQKALFKGSNNPQAGGSEGVTGQPGDQGKPNGLAGIKQYEGNGGKGNGTGYDLGGRGHKHLGSPPKEFPEEGHIVVEIWVDQEGNVVRTAIAKGTDINNNEMRNMALDAARKSKFVADPNAPKEQKGTITYTFVHNQ